MGNSNYRRTVINAAHQNIFFGLVKMTLGLVHTIYSLLQWQAVKLTFFAPCQGIVISGTTLDLIHLIHFVTAALGLIQVIRRNAS